MALFHEFERHRVSPCERPDWRAIEDRIGLSGIFLQSDKDKDIHDCELNSDCHFLEVKVKCQLLPIARVQSVRSQFQEPVLIC